MSKKSFSSRKEDGFDGKKTGVGETPANLLRVTTNNWLKSRLRVMTLGLVERSGMKDSSSEKWIRTWLQTKLRITERSKSKIPPHFWFWKRVRMGDEEDRRKGRSGKRSCGEFPAELSTWRVCGHQPAGNWNWNATAGVLAFLYSLCASTPISSVQTMTFLIG